MPNLNISAKDLLEMMSPPGLKLDESEKKLLFFRDLAAQYAAKARYGNTPNANNISRSAQTFGGLGSGGADPIAMILLNKMIAGETEQPADDKPTLEEVLVALKGSVEKIDAKLDNLVPPV